MNKKLSILITVALSVFVVAVVIRAAVVTPVFPTSLNNFSEGDVIEEEDWNAIEATIGITGSTVTSSLNYRIANLASLSENETITGNWVNTANPWADNEVVDTITASNYLLLTGGTLTGNLVGTNASLSTNFEAGGYASASAFRGSAFPSTNCTGTTFLQWSTTGAFSCATPAGGSSFSGLDFGVIGGAQVKITSQSFSDAHFTVSNTASQGNVFIDWGAGGPASLSEAETITGNWVNTANPWADNEVADALTVSGGAIGSNTISGLLTGSASISANFEIIGYASSSFFLGSAFASVGDCNDATEAIAWTTTGVFSCRSVQDLDATLTALAAYNTNGLLTQTAADTFSGRTIAGTANQLTVTNGDGVAGNPTLSIPSLFSITAASLSSNFEVVGVASISAFRLPLTTGGTLGDCDAAGDTLNWDATTGKFVCGTDASGGGVSSNSLNFDEFQNALVLDANTTVASGGFSLNFLTGGLGVKHGGTLNTPFEVGGIASISKVYLANGTNSLPSLTFSSDPDTGIYWPTIANSMDLISGGVLVFRISTNGLSAGSDGKVIRLTANTASVPGYSFTTGTNMGMYAITNSTTGVLGFSTGGVQRASISASRWEFNTGASVSSNFNVGGSNFSVTGATGNTIILGTLNVTGLSTLGAITATGVIDFGGATSFEIPNGSGGTTVDATGEVTIDSASSSFNFYDGTAERILLSEKCFTYYIESPTATNPLSIGHKRFFDPFTITKVSSTASGSNAAGWNLRFGVPGTVTTNVFTTAKSASTSSSPIYTSFANSAISDGNVLDLRITSASATLQSFSVNVCGRNNN